MTRAERDRRLAEVEAAFPVGSLVRVLSSDLPEYVGAEGRVRHHDLGDDGSPPLVSVEFDPPLAVDPDGGNAEGDGFYLNELEVIS